MANRKRQPVTDVDRLKWKALYESGMSIEEIALEVGRSMPTVRKYLAEAGTQMRPAAPRGHYSLRNRMVDGVKGKSDVAWIRKS